VIIYLATIVATILLQLFRAALDTTDGQPRRISMVQRGIDCACIVVLAAAPGFRAWHVGTDTVMYVAMYNITIDSSSWSNTLQQAIVEPGYALWEFIWRSFGLSTHWFLAITALVTNGLQYEAIRMISPKMLPAISAYAVSGLYLFQFNGMRQAMAISIFVFGVALILRGHRFGWVFLLTAALIHSSTLIVLPAFILSRRFQQRNTFNIRIVLLSGGVFLALLLISTALATFLTDLVGDKYGSYLDQNMGSGRGRLIHLALMLMVVWFLQSTELPTELRCATRFYSLGLGAQVVGLQLAVLDRVTLYFVASLPMFICFLLAHGSRARHIVLWLGIITYFFISLTHYGDLIPYEWTLS